MPEYLRALVVVVVLAAIVFAGLARPAKRIIGAADFRRWVGLWFAVTLVAFLAANFWIYALTAGLVIIVTSRREPLRPALYFLLLMAVPQISYAIPGFGMINYLFYLTHDRLLALLILLPVFFSQLTGARKTKTGWSGADRFLLLYFSLVVVLVFRGTTLTDTLRSALVMLLGTLLPYFVFSRSLGSGNEVRRVMMAYLLPAFVLAVIGAFEMAKGWHLYAPIMANLGDGFEMGYLSRAGSLRAITTAYGPIAFGYTMMIGLGFLLAFSRQHMSGRDRLIAFSALFLGLISSLSRGPWVGTVILVLVFFASGRGQARIFARFGFFLSVLLAFLSMTPFWNTFVGLIPFVGTIESANIDYRVRLFENSWIVIQRSPWFGSIDFWYTEEMQSMIQGGGIIDIVNSYIGIALSYGFVGLALFTGFFVLILRNLRAAYRSLPAEEEELRLTGRALFATLVAVLVTIATVSSVGTIPMIYWSLAGIAVAYTRVVRRLLSGRAEVALHETISQPQNYG